SAMVDQACSASFVRPVHSLPLRQLAPPWIVLVALAAAAWALTLAQARRMGNGPRTMGLALPLFLALWVLMLVAMMLPSVAPVAALMYSMGVRGPSRAVRVGFHHGATCIGCCWGLMILLVAVGVMNVAVMVALAIVIFVEKLWRYGKPFGQAIGMVLVATGVF